MDVCIKIHKFYSLVCVRVRDLELGISWLSLVLLLVHHLNNSTLGHIKFVIIKIKVDKYEIISHDREEVFVAPIVRP